VLAPIYDIIPEEDAERDIWRYKFQNHVYARSYWAPVTDENKARGVLFNWPNASFKPELIPILLDIYDSIVRLDTLPIQDKEFSEIYRYLAMTNMFQYYQMYKERQVTLEYERNVSFKDRAFYIFRTAPYYIAQYNRYVKAIDDTKAAIENDRRLAKVFESKPHAKAALYWAGTDEYDDLVWITMQEMAYGWQDIICDPCESRELKQFAKYYNEYLIWSQHPRSSFSRLSEHRKRQYRFVIESGMEYSHYIAKYLCGERFDRYTEEERMHFPRVIHKEELPTEFGISIGMSEFMPLLKEFECLREKVEEYELKRPKILEERARRTYKELFGRYFAPNQENNDKK
jgi:hypothetical protein